MARKKKSETTPEVVATNTASVVEAHEPIPTEPTPADKEVVKEEPTAKNVADITANITQKADKAMPDKASSLPENKVEFKCALCHKVFTEKEQLIRHKAVCPMNNRFDM